IALAVAAARIGAVEHGVVFRLQVRRALDRHGAADMHMRGLDLALGEADRGKEIELRIVELSGFKAERLDAELLAERPLVEYELDVEGGRKALLDGGDRLLRA